MLHQPMLGCYRGYFRDVPVYIGGREGLRADKIDEAINVWLKNVQDLIDNGEDAHPVVLRKIITSQHIKYEKIHPFIDGNGRTGRMFMNWTRLKAGLPILVIWANKKDNYYKWFI